MSQWRPEIRVFNCQYCGGVPAEMAGVERITYPSSVTIETVPCAGRVDALHLLRALEGGADGVLLVACPEGNCHHLSGNERAVARVRHVQEMLHDIGLAPERVRFAQLGIGHGQAFADLVNEVSTEIEALGPIRMGQI